MPASRYMRINPAPAQPASSVPPIFAIPMSDIDNFPSADVEMTPRLASVPDRSIAPHISVTKAGKCAVMKPS